MAMVLDGIRVVDLSTFQAAPFCCQLLADFGADVIRVEPPGGAVDRELGPFAPSGENMAVAMYGRNKRGVTLNLKTSKGKDIFWQLIKESDVLVTNMTPTAVKDLGLTYEIAREVNPRLIYASVTTFGQYGPYFERPGFDTLAQAISGHMYITGFPDTPPTKSGASFADYGSGLYGAIGILLALHHRHTTGKGQQIDVAILDACVSFMESVYAQYMVMNEIQPRLGNQRPFSSPTDSYRCKDGYVYVTITFDKMWKRFTRLIGREDLAKDPRFRNSELRRRNRDYMNSIAKGWLADKTRDEAVRALVEAGIPAAPVNTVTEAVADPQILAREMIVNVDHPQIGPVPLAGIVIKLPENPGTIRTAVPAASQHNREVFIELLGYTETQLADLKKTGVV
ncbi:MAG: CaiB/BaiF CoA transferase family protein [Syntrophales bacterium]